MSRWHTMKKFHYYSTDIICSRCLHNGFYAWPVTCLRNYRAFTLRPPLPFLFRRLLCRKAFWFRTLPRNASTNESYLLPVTLINARMHQSVHAICQFISQNAARAESVRQISCDYHALYECAGHFRMALWRFSPKHTSLPHLIFDHLLRLALTVYYAITLRFDIAESLHLFQLTAHCHWFVCYRHFSPSFIIEI